MSRKKKTNKNLLIIVLIILLLALAVGYAAFSEILTITGTANANGKFDLEFQAIEGITNGVVTSVGVNAENTKAVISPDKNTLTVTVDGLAYPGAGVEFATDIVNVGSIPATVEAVTPFNMEGSDALKNAIKIKGLDAITTEHPTLASGERCNIHFTVEWDKDATAEIGEADGTLTFGLSIQYTQKTDEIFGGKPSHSDGTNSTNTTGGSGNTNTVTPPVTDPETPPATETEVKLADLATLTTEDIGKTIDYSVTVTGNDGNEHTYSDWKVLNVNENNVQIIMSDYLPQTGVPQSALDAGLKLVKVPGYTTYSVNGDSNENLIAGLTTGWDSFAEGITGATSVSGPTKDEIENSLNEKYSIINWDKTLVKNDTLYVPHPDPYEGCFGYWLVTPYYQVSGNSSWGIFYYANIISEGIPGCADREKCVRPVVFLPIENSKSR